MEPVKPEGVSGRRVQESALKKKKNLQVIICERHFDKHLFSLLAVQGTLMSLLQHHSSKASILLCSAFFIVQLSRPYMTIGKSIALTIQTFVD